MPRRSILSAAERDSLLALPTEKDDLIRHYTFNESDMAIIRQHRGPASQLGFAIQLCYMRYPGLMLGADDAPCVPLLCMVAAQLNVSAESWVKYGQRAETRREHLLELKSVFGFQTFTIHHYRSSVHSLNDLALQTDKGIILVSKLLDNLRRQRVSISAEN